MAKLQQKHVCALATLGACKETGRAMIENWCKLFPLHIGGRGMGYTTTIGDSYLQHLQCSSMLNYNKKYIHLHNIIIMKITFLLITAVNVRTDCAFVVKLL